MKDKLLAKLDGSYMLAFGEITNGNLLIQIECMEYSDFLRYCWQVNTLEYEKCSLVELNRFDSYVTMKRWLVRKGYI